MRRVFGGGEGNTEDFLKRLKAKLIRALRYIKLLPDCRETESIIAEMEDRRIPFTWQANRKKSRLRFISWLRQYKPVLQSRYDQLQQENANLNRTIRENTKKHETAMEERARRVDSLLEKLTTVHWHEPDRGMRYTMTFTFDAEMIAQFGHQPETVALMAERFGRQVEREIVSMKFMQKAVPLRRNPYPINPFGDCAG